VAELAVIVAAADNDVIGREGDLPWHLSADLKHFKHLTMGKPLVMGRKTYESIGRPLPGRTSIVVTRDSGWSAPGVLVAHDPDSAVALAGEVADADGAGEVMVIGGAELYAQLLPRASRLYLTRVHLSAEGDTTLPPISWDQWREVAREEHGPAAGAPCGYSFLVYSRVPDVT